MEDDFYFTTLLQSGLIIDVQNIGNILNLESKCESMWKAYKRLLCSQIQYQLDHTAFSES